MSLIEDKRVVRRGVDNKLGAIPVIADVDMIPDLCNIPMIVISHIWYDGGGNKMQTNHCWETGFGDFTNEGGVELCSPFEEVFMECGCWNVAV